MKLPTTIAIVLMLMTGAERLALAEVVVPVDSVDTHVNVRLAPDAASEIVGHLERGSRLRHIRTVDGWHEVALEGGSSGFISTDWARVTGDDDNGVADSEAQLPDRDASAAGVGAHEAQVSDAATAAPARPDKPAATFDTKAPAEGAADALAASELPTDSAVAAAVTESADAGSEEAADGISRDGTAATDLGAAESGDITDVADSAGTEQAAADIEEIAIAEDTVHIAPVPAVPLAAVPENLPGLEGSVDYLVKFTAPTEGGMSQIFDNGRNVGIGTADPQQRLEVNGNIQIHERNSNVAGLMITQSEGDTGYIMHNRASTLTIGAGSVDRITITRDGNVGFGVNRPVHPVEMASGAYVTSGGVWTNSSSIEKKENVRELTPDEALAALVALEPVRFNYKADASEDYVGFIAEDAPELVATRDRTGLSAMDIVAVLTRVVQEQQKKIDELEVRLSRIPAGD